MKTKMMIKTSKAVYEITRSGYGTWIVFEVLLSGPILDEPRKRVFETTNLVKAQGAMELLAQQNS